MARDIWTQDIRQFNIPDDDDDYSAPVVRSDGRALAKEQAEQELARQQELVEAAKSRKEQEAMRELIDSGKVRHVDGVAFLRERAEQSRKGTRNDVS